MLTLAYTVRSIKRGSQKRPVFDDGRVAFEEADGVLIEIERDGHSVWLSIYDVKEIEAAKDIAVGDQVSVTVPVAK